MPDFVQVDLLPSEAKGFAVAMEGDNLESQRAYINRLLQTSGG
jgi:hypothetical protein